MSGVAGSPRGLTDVVTGASLPEIARCCGGALKPSPAVTGEPEHLSPVPVPRQGPCCYRRALGGWEGAHTQRLADPSRRGAAMLGAQQGKAQSLPMVWRGRQEATASLGNGMVQCPVQHWSTSCMGSWSQGWVARWAVSMIASRDSDSDSV